MRHIEHYFATRKELFYARYMDDFIFFTKTRRHLRKTIKSLYEFFDLGGLETHLDKTQLGRMENGFDWLGIWYAPEGPRVAPGSPESNRKLSGTYCAALWAGTFEETVEGRDR
ncbi:reverse transcriptase domain-containing protein [Serratia fonticola]|uniref:reverse transcriptase domain-containing protein n=1 Tax=Serratia fonticola TaxID=47917 RepID=UPI002DBE9572|nr:reverse transcriptase domain-containing protein [Serratia fonticola]MEB7886353.1 reverse transcriptase domain-containing protein [Serratia fonticola]